MSTFVSLQELDRLAHLADPCFRPYQGHNAFREKYFSGLNKKCGKHDNKTDVNGEWTRRGNLFKVSLLDRETTIRLGQNQDMLVNGLKEDYKLIKYLFFNCFFLIFKIFINDFFYASTYWIANK